jgi:Fe-Mn family superoxide dismutase
MVYNAYKYLINIILDYFNTTFSLVLEGIGEDYKPIKLPYDYKDLEPHIDEETMTLHFNKHYKGYINKLNDAMGKRSKPQLRDLVISANKHNDSIRNNAGGAYNHQLLWQMMTPNFKPISGDIKDAIEKKYKSFDSFKDKFTESALSNFGSGWTWLVLKGDKLDIINTPNQDNPLMINKGKPVLGIDIWEHAYYKKYGPDREKYINNYMKVIDWDFCNTLLNN